LELDTVKVGIIGCGWFGNFHLENLLTIDGVEIAALASSNAAKLKKTGEKVPEARLYSSHKELYEKENLDAVFICVPPDSHDDAEILAAQKGIHIYVEKPIELSMQKARTIEAEIKKAGIITSVGYQERYNHELEKMKNFVSSKKVGLVTARWLGGMPGTPWWRRKERSGGQIVEQSTHLFDMLRYFFGEADSVFCMGRKGLVENVPDYNVDDYSSAMISFKSGVLATVETACYLDEIKPFNGVGFRIACSDTIVEYDWDREFRYITNESAQTIPFTGSSHLKAAQIFIEAVKTGDRKLIKSPYSDAIKTLELTLASNESMRSTQPVTI
jgi:Predicted dehydrogenases and related proteins